MDKQSMRNNLRVARDALSPEARAKASGAIVDRIREWDVWNEAASVLLYHAVRSEADVTALMRTAWADGKRVGLPRVEGDRFVAAIVEPATHLAPGVFGIPQPPPDSPVSDTWDIVAVPGLGFDRTGHRIGYGQGMYDQWLADHPKCVPVGIAFSRQVLDELPHDAQDVPVRWIVTPDGIEPTTT